MLATVFIGFVSVVIVFSSWLALQTGDGNGEVIGANLHRNGSQHLSGTAPMLIYRQFQSISVTLSKNHRRVTV